MPRVTRPGGIEIPYVLEGDGAPPRLVFAHGLTGQGAHPRADLAPLLRAGWTVVTFDQRGHADATPVTDPWRYDPFEMGGDLLAILDDLGWRSAWIGGGSMGAATSLAAALTAPERVEGLVQCVPAIWDRAHEQVPLFDVWAQTVRGQGIEGAIALVKQALQQAGTGADTLGRIEDLRAHDAGSLACALETVPRWVMPQVPSGLSGLGVPLVVLGWRGDVIHPFEVAEAFAAAAPGGTLVEGDYAAAQSDPEHVGRLLLEAIGRAGASVLGSG